MFKSTKNKVARILKIYSILNVIGGFIISRYLAWNMPGTIADGMAWGYFAAVIVVSFLIYAFGELIDLLEQIKENTKSFGDPQKKAEDYSDMLPEL